MPTPDANAICAVCGLPLPGGELAARCPHCLIRLALDDDNVEAEATAISPASVRPRIFADYELIEPIAEGGMGVVWKARQLSVHRTVALKMIHAGHLASAEARIRFAAEIEATGHLEHPNIVPLLQTGDHDGLHYFTMKLLTGGDLGARRSDFGLSPPSGSPLGARELREGQQRIARLLVKIARAVHYAHLRGILHRDLKPSNVLLDEAGEPYVSDFGLAKMFTRESGFTFTQSVLGSPNYMAPEQATGTTNELTTATDVYGLGAILYELLAGHPPFRAESPVATLRQLIDQPVAPVSQSNPNIDSDLETICLKCLEKSPAARYASAEALAEDLERWIERRPIQARRVGALERTWRWCQREPALAATLGACFLLLVATAVGSTIAAVRIRQAQLRATAALRESLVNEARNLRLASDIGHREEGLRLLRQASQLGGPPEFQARARDELLATLVRTDLEFTKLPDLQYSPDPALNLASRDLSRLASVTGSNTIVIQRIPDGPELQRISTGTEAVVRLEQFSHDGRFLGIRSPNGIRIWDTETGQQTFATNGPGRLFCFAPDQPRVVVEEWGYQASFFELPSMRLTRQVRGTAPRGRTEGWSALALSPEEKTLAVARARDRVLELIDLESGDVVSQATNQASAVALAWNHDGTRLAAALNNGRVPVLNQRGRRVFDLPGRAAVAHSLAFNPEGSILAVAARDRTVRLVDTRALRNAHEVRCDAGAITFDASGMRIGPALRSEGIGWLELRSPDVFRQVTVATTSIELDDCHYSRDGRTFIAGNPSHVVFGSTSGERRLLTKAGWRINGCAFDPQSDALFASFTSGLFRWDAHWDQSRFNLTNMTLVLPGRGWRAIACNASGSHLAVANVRSNGAFVLQRAQTNLSGMIGPHADLDSIAISPDARWVATGSATDRHVRVWDAQTRAPVLAHSVGPAPRALFSADGQWLATFGDTFALYRVGTWAPAPPLPLPGDEPILGAAAFSPDGRVLAVVCDLYKVQLIDLKSFRSLGRLQSPANLALFAIRFSPDGGQLAAVGRVGRLLLWDLREAQRKLREFALDADWTNIGIGDKPQGIAPVP